MVTFFQIGVVSLLVTALFVLIKLKYIKHKLTWIAILGIMLILYLGFISSVAGHNIDLKTLEGSEEAMKLYFNWLGQSFSNVKSLTGEAIKLDWGTNTTQIKTNILP